MFRHFFRSPAPPNTLAKGEAIDLSIQFTLFWMPFLVLLGWWTNRPLTLLFGKNFTEDLTTLTKIITDLFEVTILLGSCFLVNYVTADSKTNWAEGVALVVFYIMIVSLFFNTQFLSIDHFLAFRLFAPGSTQDSRKSDSCLNAGVLLQRSWLQRVVTRLGTQQIEMATI